MAQGNKGSGVAWNRVGGGLAWPVAASPTDALRVKTDTRGKKEKDKIRLPG